MNAGMTTTPELLWFVMTTEECFYFPKNEFPVDIQTKEQEQKKKPQNLKYKSADSAPYCSILSTTSL